MKNLLLSFFTLTMLACNPESKVNLVKETKTEKTDTNKIRVLNFGSVHLSGSTDAYSSITDVNSIKGKADIQKIVEQLVKFKPTIICVEIPPESTEFMNQTFQKYKTDQSSRINYSEEVNVIGLEVARLSGTKKIYGIDNPIGFDYPKLIELANKNASDSIYVQNIMGSYEIQNKKPLLEQFAEINTTKYKMETFDLYNFLATMHTPNGFEGADIIADFYKRNLRMYTNFSDIPLTKNDRVLIIMGATHTAYFDIFIGNSPKYILENTTNYTDYTD
ncbi:DUF5694 domain-containing protein [Cellulophaga sp. F20128]|uniref:DUF5694 domain-containing protein n=1 Tax=Cellulophaga sp. F20128 TaxID=2926413 RepID=UPI001FF3D188|nr:DUF5694 domain-containing protein [Cellulophaga sp. F20128]MCK0158240.1 DUF5694 domain-containing protein [Cellulophaga sp. F20128]